MPSSDDHDQLNLFYPIAPAPDVKRELGRLGGTGVLTPSDLVSLNAGVRRVYALMKDGRWYGPDEIERAAGGGVRAREGLRRMRELRSFGFEVERMRATGNTRLFQYRLRYEGPCLERTS